MTAYTWIADSDDENIRSGTAELTYACKRYRVNFTDFKELQKVLELIDEAFKGGQLHAAKQLEAYMLEFMNVNRNYEYLERMRE